MVTPVQCFEARRLLQWSRDRLAPRCGISALTLGKFENGRTDLHPETRKALRHVLARAGIEFETGDEPGVRLREREARLALRTGRTQGRVTAILDELVREGALVGFRTNFDGRGPVWVPTVSVQVPETADLAAVLTQVEKALRPLGVAEVILQVSSQSGSRSAKPCAALTNGGLNASGNALYGRLGEGLAPVGVRQSADS